MDQALVSMDDVPLWSLTKHGQERVLALEVSREGFEWAPADSCLSHDDGWPGWAERLRRSPARCASSGIPSAGCGMRFCRTGRSRWGWAGWRCGGTWRSGRFTDITDLVGEVRAAVQGGVDARELLPVERPYGLPREPAETIGASVE